MLDITGTNIQLEKLLQYEHKQVENMVVMKQCSTRRTFTRNIIQPDQTLHGINNLESYDTINFKSTHTYDRQ